MALTDNLRKNMYLLIDGKVFFVIDRQYKTQGRQGGLIILKLRNLSNNTIQNMTVNAGTKFEEISPETKAFQYLYNDGKSYYFMDSKTFENIEVPSEIVSDYAQFMKEGDKVLALLFEDKIISFKRNLSVQLKVVDSVDAVKGNTVGGASKIVTLETGYKVEVPLFVKKGDVVSINTESGAYTGRA
jgi:elongation factor P